MREIKFRGIELESKNWVYGSLINCDPIPEIEENEYDEGAYGYQRWEVIPESVGQFTGLSDKNGVEIYEGDILDEDGFLFQVIYDVQNAKFKLKHIGPYQYPEWNRGIRMNIIGNFHENPELLNTKS